MRRVKAGLTGNYGLIFLCCVRARKVNGRRSRVAAGVFRAETRITGWEGQKTGQRWY